MIMWTLLSMIYRLFKLDLLMPHVHVFKESTPLFNVNLSFFCRFYTVSNWQVHVQS